MTEVIEQPPRVVEKSVGNRLPVQLAVVIAAFLAYGALVRWVGSDTGIRSTVPPIYAWWMTPAFLVRPARIFWLLSPVALFFLWRRFLHGQLARPASVARMLMVSVCLVFCIDIAVCLIGPMQRAAANRPIFYQVIEPFDYRGVEFTDDVRFVQSPGQFLHDYVALHGTLSLHSRTHPPGPVLFLWYVHRLFGHGLAPMALAAIAVSALGVVPAFLLAQRLYGRRIATLALGLMAVTPSLVLCGATSMDGVYVLPLLTCLYLFVAACQAPSLRAAAGLAGAMGAAMVISSLMTFSTSCLGFLFAAYALLAWLRLPNWRRVWGVLLVGALIFVAAYLLIYLSTKYNPFDCLKVSMRSDADLMGGRARSPLRYLDVSVANFAAFLFGAGFLTTLLFARQVRSNLAALHDRRPFDVMLVAFAATIAALSLSALFRWETERIWVFMIPLAVFAAARYIAANDSLPNGRRLLDFSLIALFVQTCLMHLCLLIGW